MDEKIYVAVARRDLESKSSLVWAIQNSGGKEFCIVYVHQRTQSSLFLDMLSEPKSRISGIERERAHTNLDKYLHICSQMQVSAEKIFLETDSVENGILQLISQHGVRKLVMGAASDRHHSVGMRDLQSKKAIYICAEAPATCNIWFTCNGYLIGSREARFVYANPCREARGTDNSYPECASSSSSKQFEITRGTSSVHSSNIVNDDERIQLVVREAEKLKREAHFETFKREEAFNLLQEVGQSENGYLTELKRRKEAEKSLRNAEKTFEKMRSESETRIAKLLDMYILSKDALKRLREEQNELKMELKFKEASILKSNCTNNEPPQYFICPITQDVMEDPQVAADGFTYEREAISNWFESGHEISPMTNKRLAHTSLVQNLALRSAIQEWLLLQASTS